jgi:hypothetical protein
MDGDMAMVHNTESKGYGTLHFTPNEAEDRADRSFGWVLIAIRESFDI